MLEDPVVSNKNRAAFNSYYRLFIETILKHLWNHDAYSLYIYYRDAKGNQ